MLLLLADIHLCEDIDCYCYFYNRSEGDPRVPCGRPDARKHHVGDPCSSAIARRLMG